MLPRSAYCNLALLPGSKSPKISPKSLEVYFEHASDYTELTRLLCPLH